jgi:hypothetical protein
VQRKHTRDASAQRTSKSEPWSKSVNNSVGNNKGPTPDVNVRVAGQLGIYQSLQAKRCVIGRLGIGNKTAPPGSTISTKANRYPSRCVGEHAQRPRGLVSPQKGLTFGGVSCRSGAPMLGASEMGRQDLLEVRLCAGNVCGCFPPALSMGAELANASVALGRSGD